MLAIFLDLETTGLDYRRHRPIDIAIACVDITEGQWLAGYQSLICPRREEWKDADQRSLLINGYTWERLASALGPESVAEEIEAFLGAQEVERTKSVFICQNPSFDRTFFSQLIDPYKQEALNWPYHWLDLASMFWAMEVSRHNDSGEPFPEVLSLSKNDIAARYNLEAEPTPHTAYNGVLHLLSTYQAVLNIKINGIP